MKLIKFEKYIPPSEKIVDILHYNISFIKCSEGNDWYDVVSNKNSFFYNKYIVAYDEETKFVHNIIEIDEIDRLFPLNLSVIDIELIPIDIIDNYMSIDYMIDIDTLTFSKITNVKEFFNSESSKYDKILKMYSYKESLTKEDELHIKKIKAYMYSLSLLDMDWISESDLPEKP